MKHLLKLFMMLALIGISTNTQAQHSGKSKKTKQGASIKKHQIIMQLTSGDAAVHKGLIKQLNNLKTGWGDTVVIDNAISIDTFIYQMNNLEKDLELVNKENNIKLIFDTIKNELFNKFII